MMEKRRKTAVFACIIFLVVTFTSLFYLIKEENHTCTGDDCPICACMHKAEQTVKNVGTGAANVCIQFVNIMAAVVLLSFCKISLSQSLVQWKVRLNN